MNRMTSLPLSFRQELLTEVVSCVKAGECCSLIGVSGIGKSNLARFLRRRDVQSAYFGDECRWVLLIDTHSLVFGEQSPEYMVSELMIHRLMMEIERHDLPKDFIAWANSLYTDLVEHPSAHLAIRYLERICARLVDEHELQLVFVFDQFEDLWRSLNSRFFLNLRNLRDQFKYRLAYIVMTRERLQNIREQIQEVEAFCELFSSHVYGLGMYSEDDASVMVDRLAERQNVVVDDDMRRSILALSGRHPALLRAIFWAIQRSPGIAPDIAYLSSMSSVMEECAKVWNDCTPAEQRAIRQIAAQLPLQSSDAKTLEDLKLTGLVSGDPPELFSPIFSAYVACQEQGGVPGVLVDGGLRQVWLDGQRLEASLSPLEFNLLAYLARHGGRVCSREELLQALYPKDEIFDVNDQRLDTILRRLRESLGDDARNPRYITTHRGVGLQLVQGMIRE